MLRECDAAADDCGNDGDREKPFDAHKNIRARLRGHRPRKSPMARIIATAAEPALNERDQ
jgi:hypothetical protein